MMHQSLLTLRIPGEKPDTGYQHSLGKSTGSGLRCCTTEPESATETTGDGQSPSNGEAQSPQHQRLLVLAEERNVYVQQAGCLRTQPMNILFLGENFKTRVPGSSCYTNGTYPHLSHRPSESNNQTSLPAVHRN